MCVVKMAILRYTLYMDFQKEVHTMELFRREQYLSKIEGNMVMEFNNNTIGINRAAGICCYESGHSDGT